MSKSENTLPIIKSMQRSFDTSKQQYEHEAYNKKERDDLEAKTAQEVGLADVFANVKDYKVNYGGVSYNVTKQNVSDIAVYLSVYRKGLLAGPTQPADKVQAADEAKARLDAAGLTKIAERALQHTRSSYPGSSIVENLSLMRDGVQSLGMGKDYDTFSEFMEQSGMHNLSFAAGKKEFGQVASKKTALIKEQYGVDPNLMFPLAASGKTEDKRSLVSHLSAFSSSYTNGENTIQYAPKEQVEAFRTNLNESETEFSGFNIVDGEGKGKWAVQAIVKGVPSGYIVLEPDQAEKIGLSNGAIFAKQSVKRIENVLSNNGGVTSFGEPSNIATYRTSADNVFSTDAGNFPAIPLSSNFTARVNFEKVDDSYYTYLYVNYGGQYEKLIPLEGKPSLSVIESALNKMTEQDLYEMLKSNNNNNNGKTSF